MIIQATNLRVFLGSNKTIVTFATPRELMCSYEREDKELGVGTLNISEAKFALEICIAMIQCHRNTYLFVIFITIAAYCVTTFPKARHWTNI